LPTRHQRCRMFAWRKRKESHDQPLVPHGLIWQATDEPESVEEAGSAEPQVLPEPIEMPLRSEVRPQGQPAKTGSGAGNLSISSQPVLGPVKLGAISPPISWPSPKTASVIRRTPPPISENQPSNSDEELKAPPKRPPQAVPPEAVASEQHSKLEIVEPPTQRKPRDGKLSFAPVTRGVASFSHFAGAAFDATARSVREGGRRAVVTYESLKVQEQMRRARHAAEKYVKHGVAGTRSAGKGIQSWGASCKPSIARAGSAAASFSSRTLGACLARSADITRRVRAQKFHVRIARSGLAQTFIQRSRMALSARQQAFRRNARLWTSLSMAALSALLTLGVISVVSHQAPADSSKRSATRSSAPATQGVSPAGLIAPETALASTHKSSSTVPAKSSTQSAPAVATRDSHPSPAARRAHRNADEDYVAPNTYRYYGNSGKRR
jgi:hypothetical protein